MKPKALTTERFVCPACHAKLEQRIMKATIFCLNSECRYAESQNIGFPILRGQPALIDFENSLIDRQQLAESIGASTVPRKDGWIRNRLRDFLFGRNPVSRKNAIEFLAQVDRKDSKPLILVIGGGSRGAGSDPLFEDPRFDLLVFDIYASSETDFVADARQLPFPDSSIDGIWIQAVLEHVLDPAKVVHEILRVLRHDAICYAETPFMQHVHEGAYDFTRFTLSGHRWLFKDFSVISTGTVGGPATMMLWSIRYFISALTRSPQIGKLVSVLFFWLRFFDRIVPSAQSFPSASGFFFLGKKAASPISPRDILKFYEKQRSVIGRAPIRTT